MSEDSSGRIYGGLVWVFAALCLGLVGLSAPHPAQDGLSFSVAAQLALEGVAGSYPIGEAGLQFSQAYTDAYCPGIEDCDAVIVPFLSPPPMLLLVMPLVLTGTPIVFLRTLGALSLGLGSWFLYLRLREHPALVRAFPVSLLLCIPLAQLPIENGQNSPWLFLTFAVGTAAPGPAAVLLAACALAKLSPAVVAAAFARERGPLATFVGVVALGVGAAFVLLPDSAGFSTWLDLVPELGELAASHPENVSVHRLLGRAAPVWVLAVLASAGAHFPRLDPPDRWALLWLAWLVAIPLVWTHYLWVGFGALWWLVGRRLSSETAAFGLAAWCVAGSFFGTWTAIWLVLSWLGTVSWLSRVDAPGPTAR